MAIKTMVKLKITRYNLKGVDDWFRQELFLYCRFSGRGHSEVNHCGFQQVFYFAEHNPERDPLSLTHFSPPKTPSDSFFSGSPDLAPQMEHQGRRRKLEKGVPVRHQIRFSHNNGA